MQRKEIEEALCDIIAGYKNGFSGKIYAAESIFTDPLMDAFGITQTLKQENKQYWGRELGMCWQRLVTMLFKMSCRNFRPALRVGADEPCDFCVGKRAIDTKYRIGSGDSGTLKKFRKYGQDLKRLGYQPVLLFVRTDNLKAALCACKQGGWSIYQGDESFRYILERTGFDLKQWLIKLGGTKEFNVTRTIKVELPNEKPNN